MDSYPPAQPFSNPSRRTPLLFGILIGLAVGWFLVAYVRGNFRAGQGTPRAVTPRADLAEEEETTIAIFENAAPSVVFITTLTQQTDIFGLNIFEIPQGAGSGFIWDDAGHVVTNLHVLRRATVARVTLADHKSYDAKFVGAAPEHDLAVLRIDAPPRDLVPIPIGTSAGLRVGQRVQAIGNPFGLDQTLTVGVVSALGRTIPSLWEDVTIDGVIQTDAAINPGNSGGPLLDSAGRLIGVNTQIRSPSGASAGIGFAIPVDIVNQVVPDLITYGRVKRAQLGIYPVEDSLARRIGVKGVVVREVSPDGGAAAAGLRGLRRDRTGDLLLGDVIVAIDDHTVDKFDDLIKAMEQYEAGDQVKVTFIRDGKRMTATVRLGS